MTCQPAAKGHESPEESEVCIWKVSIHTRIGFIPLSQQVVTEDSLLTFLFLPLFSYFHSNKSYFLHDHVLCMRDAIPVRLMTAVAAAIAAFTSPEAFLPASDKVKHGQPVCQICAPLERDDSEISYQSPLLSEH